MSTAEVALWRVRGSMQALSARVVLLVLGAIAAVGFLSAVACGCSGSGPQTPTLTPRQVARATVATLDSAFVAGAEACLSVAKTEQSDALRQQCAKAFQPMIHPLETAADAIDAWGDATQGQVACLAQDIVAGLASAGVMLQQLGLPAMPAIEDAIAFAQPFLPGCTREAGAPDAASSGPPLPTLRSAPLTIPGGDQ